MLPKSCGGPQNTRLGKFGSFLRFTFKVSKLTFIHHHLQPIKMQLLGSRTKIRSSKLDARQSSMNAVLSGSAIPCPKIDDSDNSLFGNEIGNWTFTEIG